MALLSSTCFLFFLDILHSIPALTKSVFPPLFWHGLIWPSYLIEEHVHGPDFVDKLIVLGRECTDRMHKIDCISIMEISVKG